MDREIGEVESHPIVKSGTCKACSFDNAASSTNCYRCGAELTSREPGSGIEARAIALETSGYVSVEIAATRPEKKGPKSDEIRIECKKCKAINFVTFIPGLKFKCNSCGIEGTVSVTGGQDIPSDLEFISGPAAPVYMPKLPPSPKKAEQSSKSKTPQQNPKQISKSDDLRDQCTCKTICFHLIKGFGVMIAFIVLLPFVIVFHPCIRCCSKKARRNAPDGVYGGDYDTNNDDSCDCDGGDRDCDGGDGDRDGGD